MGVQLGRVWFEIDPDDWLQNDGTLTILELTIHKCDACFSIGGTILGVQIILGFVFGGESGESSQPFTGTQSQD